MQLHLDPAQNVFQYQWMTPEWAALRLVEQFFPDLFPSDLVVEPSCGLGSFLKAIPADVPAIGVEIDPVLAKECRERTGREVITADFRTAALPDGVSAVIGNPPFSVDLISGFISRITRLPNCDRCGLLLPAYALQTHNTVNKWRDRWAIEANVIPRRLFPRLRLPLLFVLFRKSASREMVGFALYDEAVQIENIADDVREVLTDGVPRKGAWVAVVEMAIEYYGGEAEVRQIYEFIEPKRPTPNAWWKEQVRQVLQRHFEPVQRGRWRKP